MEKEKALNTLINAVEVGQRKGAYSLQDAGEILLAISILKKQDVKEGKKE